MPRQLIPPVEVLYDILGVAPAAGGLLYTYELGTTTPKETHADYAQAVQNTNPIELDSSGRVETPVWGDGEYTLVLTNADDEVIKTWESRPEQPTATVVPVPDAGEFVTGDGENYALATIREVPDPTGSSGHLLSNDGANSLWVSAAAALAGLIPEAPELDISIAANKAVIGDGTSNTKLVIQTGTGTATGGGGGVYFVSATVAFPTAFDALWYVGVMPTTAAVHAGTSGKLPAVSVTSWSQGSAASSVTANFATTEDDIGSGSNIQNSIPFAWFAIGTVTES